MATPLHIATTSEADAVVLTVRGELDMSNTARLREALEAVLATRTSIVVDLRGVDYCDSSGLAVLLPYARTIHVRAPRLLETVMTVAGLTRVASVEFADADGS